MGKYKLLKTIGKGNFAKVKLAKHMPTGQEVCTCISCLMASNYVTIGNGYKCTCRCKYVYMYLMYKCMYICCVDPHVCV